MIYPLVIGQALKKKNQKPLFEALQKVKEGLLFASLSPISLFVLMSVVSQGSRICGFVTFEYRVDAVGVHITSADGVPGGDPEDLHPRGVDEAHASLQEGVGGGAEGGPSDDGALQFCLLCRCSQWRPAAALGKWSRGGTLQQEGLFCCHCLFFCVKFPFCCEILEILLKRLV